MHGYEGSHSYSYVRGVARAFTLLFLGMFAFCVWSEALSLRRAERIRVLEAENSGLRENAKEHNRRMWHAVRMAKLFTGRFAFTDTRPEDDPLEDKVRPLEYAIVKTHGCPESDIDTPLFDSRFSGCDRKEYVSQ